MATTGRPSLLTPDLQSKIVQLITAGCYPEVAAGACGVSRTTFYEWMQRAAGDHPDRPATDELLAFADAITEAIDASEVRLVMKLAEFEEGRKRGKRKDADGRSKWVKSRITVAQLIAAQWKLSRRFSERWGQRPAGTLSITPGERAPSDGDAAGVTIAITYAAPENT